MNEDNGWKTGFVCFMDVLGYKNAVAANQGDTIKEIVQILSNTGGKAREAQIRYTKLAQTPEMFSEIASRIQLQNTSDSLFVFLEGNTNDPSELLQTTVVFSSYCAVVWGDLFKNGLPSRGSIGYGEFYQNGSIFAGSTPIEAYEYGEAIDAALIVFAPSLQNAVVKWTKEIGKEPCFDCAGIPIKNKGTFDMMIPPLPFAGSDKTDVAPKVYQAFTKYFRLFHGLRKFQRHFLMFVEGRSKTFSLKYS